MTAKQKYIVLIGDIVSSKTIKQRDQFQRNLQSALAALNSNRDGLLAPYTITLGDEFQAAGLSHARLFPDVFFLMQKLHPVLVRIAIGVGTIDTEINPEQTLAMDGQAFHRARTAIGLLRKQKGLLAVNGLSSPVAELVSGNLAMISFQLQKWKSSRFVILHHLLTGKSVKEIAHMEKLTDKAIYKAIQTNGIVLIQQVIEEIACILATEIGSH